MMMLPEDVRTKYSLYKEVDGHDLDATTQGGGWEMIAMLPPMPGPDGTGAVQRYLMGYRKDSQDPKRASK